MTTAFVRILIRQLAGFAADPIETDLPTMLRHAHRRTHPDLGGSTADSARVNAIEEHLRDAGLVR